MPVPDISVHMVSSHNVLTVTYHCDISARVSCYCAVINNDKIIQIEGFVTWESSLEQ